MIQIRGKKARCPLCQRELQDQDLAMPFEDDDPFVRLANPKVSFIKMIRTVTFICICLEILLGAVQIITGGSGWILAAMLIVLLGWADFQVVIYYRTNLIRMLTTQGYIIMAACLIIVTFAAAKIQKMELHEFILYPVFNVLMSLLQIIPIALGTNPIIAPAVICMAIMLILGSSLVVFRGRVLREAVEKYLHL